MSDWRRIDPKSDRTKAPWDGVPVLLAHPNAHCASEWVAVVAKWREERDGTAQWVIHELSESACCVSPVVTHWQPLPAPPEAP